MTNTKFLAIISTLKDEHGKELDNPETRLAQVQEDLTLALLGQSWADSLIPETSKDEMNSEQNPYSVAFDKTASELKRVAPSEFLPIEKD